MGPPLDCSRSSDWYAFVFSNLPSHHSYGAGYYSRGLCYAAHISSTLIEQPLSETP
jgi:hypothetical protein